MAEDFLRAGNDGGAGCHDIIDHQDMPAFAGRGIQYPEGVLHVVHTLQSVLVGLAGGEGLPAYHNLGDRYARDLMNALGDEQRLVVAALPTAFTGNRDGDNQVDVIEESFFLKLPGRHSSEEETDLRLAVVFQILNEQAGGGVGMVVEQGGTALDGNPAVEELGHLVVLWPGGEMGAWQTHVALHAQKLFVRCQDLSADPTGARGNQVHQVV